MPWTRDRAAGRQPATGGAVEAVVIDDDAGVRRRVRGVLEPAGITVVAEGADGRDAIRLTSRHRPDVALIGAAMPDVDAVAATRAILERDPRQVIVVLTDTGEEELGWLATYAGAAGFVDKDADLDGLAHVVRGAAAGEAALSRVGLRVAIDRLHSAS